MSPSDIESLRSSLVKSHNVLLSKDDPIFVAVQLNELVLSTMLAEVKALAQEARNESIAVVAHQVEVAKAAAAKLINETAQFVAREAQAQVKSAISVSLAAANESARLSQRASFIALGAAATALTIASAAAGVIIAVFFKH